MLVTQFIVIVFISSFGYAHGLHLACMEVGVRISAEMMNPPEQLDIHGLES